MNFQCISLFSHARLLWKHSKPPEKSSVPTVAPDLYTGLSESTVEELKARAEQHQEAEKAFLDLEKELEAHMEGGGELSKTERRREKARERMEGGGEAYFKRLEKGQWVEGLGKEEKLARAEARWKKEDEALELQNYSEVTRHAQSPFKGKTSNVGAESYSVDRFAAQERRTRGAKERRQQFLRDPNYRKAYWDRWKAAVRKEANRFSDPEHGGQVRNQENSALENEVETLPSQSAEISVVSPRIYAEEAQRTPKEGAKAHPSPETLPGVRAARDTIQNALESKSFEELNQLTLEIKALQGHYEKLELGQLLGEEISQQERAVYIRGLKLLLSGGKEDLLKGEMDWHTLYLLEQYVILLRNNALEELKRKRSEALKERREEARAMWEGLDPGYEHLKTNPQAGAKALGELFNYLSRFPAEDARARAVTARYFYFIESSPFLSAGSAGGTHLDSLISLLCFAYNKNPEEVNPEEKKTMAQSFQLYLSQELDYPLEADGYMGITTAELSKAHAEGNFFGPVFREFRGNEAYLLDPKGPQTQRLREVQKSYVFRKNREQAEGLFQEWLQATETSDQGNLERKMSLFGYKVLEGKLAPDSQADAKIKQRKEQLVRAAQQREKEGVARALNEKWKGAGEAEKKTLAARLESLSYEPNASGKPKLIPEERKL